MYQYKTCGLNNVYLKNGYKLRTGAHGEAVSIADIEGLHRTIAKCLVKDKRYLTGPEFRFLRKYLDMSQKRLGLLVGVDEQTVRYWEKLGRVPKWADHWARNLCLQKIDNASFEELIDKLNSLDRAMVKNCELRFSDTNEGWLSQVACH